MENSVQSEHVSDIDLEVIFSGGAEQPIGDEGAFYECVNPWWSISREGLMKILRIVLSFPSKTSIFMAVWKKGDEIWFHANNRDALVEAQLPLLNAKPFETDKVYFLDSARLYAFLNSYSQFALSFDPDATIYYESPYVRYKLDTVKLNLDDVRIKVHHNDYSNWVKFPISKSGVGVFKALYGFAVKLSDSKILINKKQAEAFYTLYKFDIRGRNGTSIDDNVIIRRLDLSTLKEIVDDNTQFSFTSARLFFKLDYGFVSFIRVPYDEESFMYPETFATGKDLCAFTIDVPLVKRALKLSSLFSVDSFSFSFDGSDVYMVISDKAKFKVGNLFKGDSRNGESYTVGMDIFSNLLSTISDNSFTVYISEHGVQLSSLGEPMDFYSMARVSMNQIKKGNLPPVLDSKPQSEKVDFQDKEVF